MACATSPRRSSCWYTPNEVKEHCTLWDCWVTLLGSVYDITSLMPRNPQFLAKMVYHEAGGDISRWFDPQTKDVNFAVDPVSKIETYHVPEGRFAHVPPTGPRSDWNTGFEVQWWKDPHYIIGRISAKTRIIRIRNVLIDQEIKIEVPCEENISEIIERYEDYNCHATSYNYKALCMHGRQEFVEVDMTKTLEENGIDDESHLFLTLGLPQDYYIPSIYVYYTDDLTVA